MDYYTQETCHARAHALAHLRPDLDPQAIMQRLVARGSMLAPVERDWDPDISRFLERTLIMVPIDQRRDRERAYNSFRPTVREWIPANAVPPPELDVAKAAMTYSDQAENILVIVHTRLDIVGSSDPEWLEHLDAFFWTYAHDYFTQPAHLEKMVIAIGAFLGNRLVRRRAAPGCPDTISMKLRC